METYRQTYVASSDREVDQYIERYQLENKVRFVKIKSNKPGVNRVASLDKCKLMFRNIAIPDLENNQTPFINLCTDVRECRNGPNRHLREIRQRENGKQEIKRQTTSRKTGCPAKIVLKRIIMFPQYTIDKNTDHLRRKKLTHLRHVFSADNTVQEYRVYVDIVGDHEHQETEGNNNYPLDKRVIEFIKNKVKEGCTSTTEMQKAVEEFADSIVPGQSDKSDSSYYPSKRTIYNHMYGALSECRSIECEMLGLEQKTKYIECHGWFLKGRSEEFVNHCLDRMPPKCEEFTRRQFSRTCEDPVTYLVTNPGNKQTTNMLHLENNLPRCTCLDFLEHHSNWPCKHLIALFLCHREHNWDLLNNLYGDRECFDSNAEMDQCETTMNSDVSNVSIAGPLVATKIDTVDLGSEIFTDSNNTTTKANFRELREECTNLIEVIQTSLNSDLPVKVFQTAKAQLEQLEKFLLSKSGKIVKLAALRKKSLKIKEQQLKKKLQRIQKPSVEVMTLDMETQGEIMTEVMEIDDGENTQEVISVDKNIPVAENSLDMTDETREISTQTAILEKENCIPYIDNIIDVSNQQQDENSSPQLNVNPTPQLNVNSTQQWNVNSTQQQNDNSTQQWNVNSTQQQNNNSTQQQNDNSTQQLNVNSTQQQNDNSTQQRNDHSTQQLNDNSTQQQNDNSTQQRNDNSTQQLNDNSTHQWNDNATQQVNVNPTLQLNVNPLQQLNVNPLQQLNVNPTPQVNVNPLQQVNVNPTQQLIVNPGPNLIKVRVRTGLENSWKTIFFLKTHGK